MGRTGTGGGAVQFMVTKPPAEIVPVHGYVQNAHAAWGVQPGA